ncbi:MAG: hypothetical protein ACE5HS_04495 [bacterium]
MCTRDPHRFSNQIDDTTTQHLIDRLESRAKDGVFTNLFDQYITKMKFPEEGQILEIGGASYFKSFAEAYTPLVVSGQRWAVTAGRRRQLVQQAERCDERGYVLRLVQLLHLPITPDLKGDFLDVPVEAAKKSYTPPSISSYLLPPGGCSMLPGIVPDRMSSGSPSPNSQMRWL